MTLSWLPFINSFPKYFKNSTFYLYIHQVLNIKNLKTMIKYLLYVQWEHWPWLNISPFLIFCKPNITFINNKIWKVLNLVWNWVIFFPYHLAKLDGHKRVVHRSLRSEYSASFDLFLFISVTAVKGCVARATVWYHGDRVVMRSVVVRKLIYNFVMLVFSCIDTYLINFLSANLNILMLALIWNLKIKCGKW